MTKQAEKDLDQEVRDQMHKTATFIEEMRGMTGIPAPGPTLVDLAKLHEDMTPNHLRSIQIALGDNYTTLLKLTQRIENVAKRTLGYSFEEKEETAPVPRGLIFEIQSMHNTLDSALRRLDLVVEVLESL